MSVPKDRQIKAEPYNWPHDNSLSPQTTALIIVDMQRDFCSPGGYLEAQGYDISPVRALIPTLQRLLLAFRKGHRPDLSTLSSREHFRSYNNVAKLGIGSHGPLGRLLIRGETGHDIVPELYPLPHEPVIDKPGRGAFSHTELELMLRIKGVRNLVLCGVTTDVCVSSTMREANDRAFDCVLLGDATAASETLLCDATIRSVKAESGIFGAITGVDEIINFVEQSSDQTL